MSKFIKQMQLEALSQRFEGVRDLIVMSISGLSVDDDNIFRTEMAKKGVDVLMVKNTFARKVLREQGLSIPDDSEYWEGPTHFAWGGSSVGELSRVIDDELTAPKKATKYRKAVKIKGAIVDGQPLDFAIAKKMPTREEAIANVIGLALAPAMKIAGQLTASAATLVGQIKEIGEGKGGSEENAA